MCAHTAAAAHITQTNAHANRTHANTHKQTHSTLNATQRATHTPNNTHTYTTRMCAFVYVCDAWRMQQAGHKRRWCCCCCFFHIHNHTSLSEWRGYRSEGDVDVRFTFARVVDKVCVWGVGGCRYFTRIRVRIVDDWNQKNRAKYVSTVYGWRLGSYVVYINTMYTRTSQSTHTTTTTATNT